MKTFKLDKNNDFTIGVDGNLEIIEGKDALAQVAANYAQSTRGEMLSKINKGMPFFQTTFGANASIPQFEAAFRLRMLEIEEVAAVLSFEASITDGVLSYHAVLQSSFGEIEVADGGL